MRGLTGKIKRLKSDKKRRAILKLKLVIELYMPEQKLWFRVIEQAVEDLDHKQPRYRSNGFFKREQPLSWICDNIDIDKSIIFRVLKNCEVL